MGRGTGNRPRRAKDDAKDEARRQRADEVFRLRIDRLTFRAIGEQLGISHVQAMHDFDAAAKRRGAESREEARAVGLATVDAVLEGHVKAARAGDADSAKVVIQAATLHAKINGYLAPEQHEHMGAVKLGPSIFIPAEHAPEHHTNGVNGAANGSPGGLATKPGPANGVPPAD